jgi:hypothetical protein
MDFSRLSKELFFAASLAGFAIITFGVYEQASCKIMKSIKKLEIKALHLQEAIKEEEALQVELKMQGESLSDPSWVELALIKSLGLVPEGYTKIYYDEKKP